MIFGKSLHNKGQELWISKQSESQVPFLGHLFSIITFKSLIKFWNLVLKWFYEACGSIQVYFVIYCMQQINRMAPREGCGTPDIHRTPTIRDRWDFTAHFVLIQRRLHRTLFAHTVATPPHTLCTYRWDPTAHFMHIQIIPHHTLYAHTDEKPPHTLCT